MKKFAATAIAASMFVLAACDNTPAPPPTNVPNDPNYKEPKDPCGTSGLPREQGEGCK